MAGLTYAYGPLLVDEGIPASSFSRGDFLVLNSSSSLSRIAIIETGADIAGVAMCDSTQSINNKCTYAIPDFATVFWSVCTPGSTFTKGANVNYNEISSRPVANTSAGTVRAVCERGVLDCGDQSVQSRILVRLVSNAGGLNFS
jgi:hypothetical protein